MHDPGDSRLCWLPSRSGNTFSESGSRRAQSFRVVTCLNQLDRRKEVLNENFFWLSRFWRITSATDTMERLSSRMPSAIPLHRARYPALSIRARVAPDTVTSSGWQSDSFRVFQSISNVSVVLTYLGLHLTRIAAIHIQRLRS